MVGSGEAVELRPVCDCVATADSQGMPWTGSRWLPVRGGFTRRRCQDVLRKHGTVPSKPGNSEAAMMMVTLVATANVQRVG